MSAGLFARFDTRVLRVAPLRPLAAVQAADAAPLVALRDWCLAEPQRRLAWRPAEAAPGVDLARALEALQRELDGDFQLQALAPGWPRLALRLRVKLADALPARWRPADAPWDAGYLADDPAVRAALRQFRPRRPTLIVSDPMPEAALQASLEALHAAAPGFARPVRLLVQPG